MSCDEQHEANHSYRVQYDTCIICNKKGELKKVLDTPVRKHTIQGKNITKAGATVKDAIEEAKDNILKEKKRLQQRSKK